MHLFVEEKEIFLNILSLFFFFTPNGAKLYREGTEWAKGHLYALMGHLALHNQAPYI